METTANEILDYLSTRRYAKDDILRSSRQGFVQSPLQYLVSLKLQNDASPNNAYIYSCTDRSITQIDEEFEKLRSWINNMKDIKCKDQLKQILFPVFFHLYLNILEENISESRSLVSKFFVKYQQMFVQEEEHIEMLTDLSMLENIGGIINFPLVVKFRSSKFEIRLSAQALFYLKKYLLTISTDPVILLNILNTWFSIVDSSELWSSDDEDCHEMISNCLPIPGNSKILKLENLLQDVLQKLTRNGEIHDEPCDTDENDSETDDSHDSENTNDNTSEAENDNTEEFTFDLYCKVYKELQSLKEMDFSDNSSTEISGDESDHSSDSADVLDGIISDADDYNKVVELSLLKNIQQNEEIFDKIKHLPDMHPKIKSVVTFKVEHPRKITCGIVSLTKNIIAIGLFDSTVQLWDISEENNFVPTNKYAPSNKTLEDSSIVECVPKKRMKISISNDHSKNGTADSTDEKSDNGDEDVEMEVDENSLGTDDKKNIFKKFKTSNIPDEEVNKKKSDHYKCKLITLRGHLGPITDIKIPDHSNLLLSTSYDTTMRLWNLDDFSCSAVYTGHSGAIWALDVSSLNMYIATASQDTMAKLWTFSKSVPVRIYVGHSDAVCSVKFHTNNLYLATGSFDCTIRLFNVLNGEPVRLLTNNPGPVFCLSFSPDGSWLASAGKGNQATVWDVARGCKYTSINFQRDTISSLNWSSNSQVLAVTFLKQFVFFCSLKQHRSSIGTLNAVAYTENPGYTYLYSQFSKKNVLSSVVVI